jgi:hypothetical protein
MNLIKEILEVGIDNCLFLVPMRPLNTILGFSFTSSSDPEFVVTAKITEERYKVSENYKLTLKSTMDGFGKNQGIIEFYVKTKQKTK